MMISIEREMASAIGFKKLAPFGLDEKDFSWRGKKQFSLVDLDDTKLDKLKKLLADSKDVDGAVALSRDVSTWIAAKEDITGAKPRTVKQFHGLLLHYLLKVEGHRLYMKEDGNWLAYYIYGVNFEDANKRNNTPPRVYMKMAYEDFGGRRSASETFHFEDIRGRTIVEALLSKGLVAETPDLRKEHLRQAKRFEQICNLVGTQFNCRGDATDEADGNPDSNMYSHETFAMLREGVPSRVVMDVFHEDEKRRDDSKVTVDPTYWDNVRKGKIDDDGEGSGDDDGGHAQPEIPLHPYCAVFDLGRHLRLRTHVMNMTEHVYDDHLSDKLVLDEEMKNLVELLLDHQDGGFKDIVAGKGGGAVVLLGGPPGVGKTLTAEVYAESKHMPLYNVQCSQLGMDAIVLEERLLKVFRRAKRWNAIVLLDEADVYVRERGNDLAQNAIVGVFLRVLEYQGSVLFLATNRPDEVDDAIASRCMARLNYKKPDVVLEAKIWRVLADTSGAKISDQTVVDLVRRLLDSKGVALEGRSGRDVKNLLKLAMLVTKGKEIKADTVKFVERFQPWKKHVE
jgi:ATPase family protein associated with various cellular activities (AAA)